MYAYCNNNPVLYVDPTGEFPWHFVIGGVTGGIAGDVSARLGGGDILDVVFGFASGFANGMLAASIQKGLIRFKCIAIFYKTAHNSSKEFVLTTLSKSSLKNAIGSIVVLIKNKLKEALE